MQTKGFSITVKPRLLFGLLCGLVLCSSDLLAQISAPNASYSSPTEYSSGAQDNIFVFSDEFAAGVGELKAVSPDGISGWDFTWTKWNSATTSFEAAFQVDNGLSESIVSDLGDGLYHVKIEKGAIVREYQAWVINHLKGTNQPVFTKTDMDCSGLYFLSSYVAAKDYYYDFPSSNPLELSRTLIFSFQHNGLEIQGPAFVDYDGTNKSFVYESAFKGEESFTMTVIDECGFEYTSDAILSKTYKVDPRFNFNPASGEAPLNVNFEIENLNDRAEYEWYFYQDTSRIDGPVPAQDSLLTDIKTDINETYTYLHPGKYFVKLIARNNDDAMNCVEEFVSSDILVESSLFEVPNVFTPNGDGANDVFRLKLYSVKSYSAKIFNRWGRLVYEFQESDVKYANAGYDVDIIGSGSEFWYSVKGWNGKINGKLATPGTYFYVIEAEGREETGKHYTERGAVMLLHDK
ncbi:T9SS type B sorting domain-containing protein [Ancylomarina salipaludis]|uniref:T9SS type B sorting domain-containing protein n=1 Tax=Ancylomarina salipaludis TaxID=2501299 RepID=A0A4Q1JP08_9BACT|nr:gliding motility-associated C-terminal domain-containing protein [Ancylomarina salipaludis]RXQ96640.1 T9SS type B sorting domain-containing protein [Ancylomarina salipaludis]